MSDMWAASLVHASTGGTDLDYCTLLQPSLSGWRKLAGWSHIQTGGNGKAHIYLY